MKSNFDRPFAPKIPHKDLKWPKIPCLRIHISCPGLILDAPVHTNEGNNWQTESEWVGRKMSEASSIKRASNYPPNTRVLNQYWGGLKVWASLWNRPCEHILRNGMDTVIFLRQRTTTANSDPNKSWKQLVTNYTYIWWKIRRSLDRTGFHVLLDIFLSIHSDLYRFALAESSLSLIASIICLDLS